MEKAHPQVWLHNFTNGVSDLIAEKQARGYVVKAVQVSPSIFNKITSIMGLEPNSICGYIIEIVPPEKVLFERLMNEDLDYSDEDEIDESDIEGYVAIRAEPIC